jgi:uncharacterized protein
MPPVDHKTQSGLICVAQSRLCAGGIVRARSSLPASQIALGVLSGISNRQFLVRLETSINHSKQTVEPDSNRHFWDPLLQNVFSRRAIYLIGSTNKMEIRESQRSVSFYVRVAPRASQDAIEGEHAGALKIRLTAPPVDDRANQSLRRLLAQGLKVPLSAVRIVSGEKSRIKRVVISGVTRDQVIALSQPEVSSGAKQDSTRKTKD